MYKYNGIIYSTYTRIDNLILFQHDVYQNQKLAHWNHGVCMCMTTMDTGVHIPNIGIDA